MKDTSPEGDEATRIAPPRPETNPAAEVPDHKLLRRVGRGSYGEVWLARNVMGTYRAVKVVYRRTFDDERPYEREFGGIQKFEPISRSHEGLVDILQIGRNEREGYYYYVMELADDSAGGQELALESYQPKTLGKEVSTRGRLPFTECLQLGMSLATALGHLHKHGLIHRDIKPSNIIFVNGIPKIADIGLVAAVGSSQSFVGTEGFIPPEGPGSVQADIFSLGKVLYEISTGQDRRTFRASPAGREQIRAEKEWLEFNEVIQKACAADPLKRYQSAEEMQADLLVLQAGRSVKRLRLLERRFAFLTRVGWIAAGIAIVALAAYYQERRLAAHRLAVAYVANGTRSLDEGDLFGSLPWFAEALQLEQGNRTREKRYRGHIGMVLKQCPRILRMWFHDATINDVQFSPDGRQIVTAGDDHAATVWSADSDRQTLRLTGHSKELCTASFNHDGRLIVTASEDGSARVWEASTGRQFAALLHGATVYCASFNRDGDRIVTACGDRTARIWEWATDHPPIEFAQHADAIRSASFSPNGRRIVTASQDRTAQVWDVATRKPVGAPMRHGHWVFQASFDRESRRIVTASFDNTARIWDAETGQLLLTLEHEAGVRSAEFSPDGRYVATACYDSSARVWDAATGKAFGPPLKHNSFVMYAAFSPDGRRLVTASTHGVACLWDLSPAHWMPPASAPFVSPNGDRLVTVQGNQAQVWAAATSNAVSPPLVTSNAIYRVVSNWDASRVVTLSSETSDARSATIAQLWDASTGHALCKPFSCPTAVTNAAIGQDGLRMVTIASNIVQTWNMTAGKPLSPELRLPRPVIKASLNRIGTSVVLTSGKEASIWDIALARPIFLRHASDVSHAEFSPDSRKVVTACWDRSLAGRYAQVWDAHTGDPVGKPLAHRDGVLFSSFSPDSKRVVTASEDFTAQVWDAATGKRIGSPLKHKFQVNHAAFSPDGRRVVTGSQDKTARMWDAETGEPLSPLLRHPWPVRRADFTASGRRIVTRRATGESRSWELSEDLRPVQDLVLLAQLLSGHQGDPSGGALPMPKEDLRASWTELRSKYPLDFAESLPEILSWHEQEAQASEAARQWSAAIFHLDLLLVAQPADPPLRQRRARAQMELARQMKPATAEQPADQVR